MKPLHIQTDRLLIRNLRSTDLEDFHVYRSNPEVTRYQGFDVMNLEEARSFIEKQQEKLFGKPGEWVQYGLEDRARKKLIGDCAIKLQEDDPRIAEVGITVSHLEQQKGFAKEAFTGILDFLFGEEGLHRVEETVDVENVASIRLLESMGFRQEGHFIENIFFNGKWGSEYRYAMLEREWELSKTKTNLRSMKFFSVCLTLLSIIFLNACSGGAKGGPELNLESVRLKYDAEKVETSVKIEKSMAGEGKHLTVDVINSAALEREGFKEGRAFSFSALTTYEACTEKLRSELVAIRIAPTSDAAIQFTESTVYPTEKLEIQARCKRMADQFIKGRLEGDSLLIFSSFNSQFIPDSIISFNLLRLSEQWGALQSSEYEGAGDELKLPDGKLAKGFYFKDTYEKGVLRTRFAISIGPDNLIVGFTTGKIGAE